MTASRPQACGGARLTGMLPFGYHERPDWFDRWSPIRDSVLRCRSGGTGRRTGLKIPRYLVPWGFDPPLRHSLPIRLMAFLRIPFSGVI